MQQIVEPGYALPHQFYVGRIAQMTLIAGGIAQTQILIFEQRFPVPEKDALLPYDVEFGSQSVAYGADYLAVLYRIRRINENAAEHLHVNVAVEHFHQTIVRQPSVRLEEHQSHLTLWREHGRIALRMLFGEMRRQFPGHLLEWKHGMNAPEFANGEALAVFLQKIVFCKG